MKNNLDGISIIIPAFGDIKTVSNSVFSCFKQQLGKKDEPRPKVEVLIMNDDIEHKEMYNCFLDMKDFHSDDIEVKVIDNEKYMNSSFKLYQGGSRIVGAQIAKYTFCLFLDCDDILAPNCVRNYWVTPANSNSPSSGGTMTSGLCTMQMDSRSTRPGVRVRK